MTYREDFNEGASEVSWTGRRITIMVVGFLILFGVISTVVHFVTKPLEVLDKVTDADRMIYNYQWFHSQWGQVKAVDDQIGTKKDEIGLFKDDLIVAYGYDGRSKWTPEDRRELGRKQVELTGLRQHRATLVQEYNARAGDRTRSFLLDNKLPERIQ